jgi:hypothetical protein
MFSALASDGSRSMTRLTSLAMDIAIEISQTLANQTLQEIKAAEDRERIRKPALVVELDSQGEDNHNEANFEYKQPFGLGFVKSMKSMHTVIKYFLLVCYMLARFTISYCFGGEIVPSHNA